MIVIGLDPGTITGFAKRNTALRAFEEVSSYSIHRAMDLVLAEHRRVPDQLLVIFEDARLRQFFSKVDKQQEDYGDGVREGAGAAKRDAAIWDDFLADHKIPSISQAPRGTKRSAQEFRVLTGWQGRTNEHSRDAGLMIFGIDERRAAVLMATARRAM